MSEDRAAAAISRLSQITTEMAARRELRDRSAAAALAQSRESMSKMGAVAEKVAEHLGELGRRQREAGGWATGKTLADRDRVIGFDPEDEELAEAYTGYTVPANAARDELTAAVFGDEQAAHQVAQPATAPVNPPLPEPAVSRGRRARDDEPDDDDFSDTSSWLKD